MDKKFLLLGWSAVVLVFPALGVGLDSIKVPAGFVVELAAGPPLVKYPMLGGFDEQGRLYVCESSGGNYNEAGLRTNLPNFVRRITDTDGDGRFDQGTMFADKMTFPEGALWRDGALYVTSPPYLWRLEDTDGDGVADRREPILGKFRSLGHAGDIHGPFLAPDGRLAFTDAPLGHEIRDKQGQLIQKGTAARVFLCDTEGGNLETFCGGGTFNPVEVEFTPAGEMIGIMTWFNPEEARYDALVHYVLNGVYPRRIEAWINEFKRSGPLMPAITRYGVLAPSGIARYRSAVFGPGFKDTFFISFYNTHRVNRVLLERDGATFRATETPFLESSDPDFRACDVIEDADGSLLVIDTGGWFINGCPSSKIARPEKLGAIYRIRKAGAPRFEDPRGLKLDWKSPSTVELARRLADPRPVVSQRAMELLGHSTPANRSGLAALLVGSPEESVRLQAVWALARHRSAESREILRRGFNDNSLNVRLAVARGAGMEKDAGSLRALLRMLEAESPAERREAASALSRLALPEAVPALIEGLAKATDRFLEHALIDALTRIRSAELTLKGLDHPSAPVRRGSLIALDQMDDQSLPQDRAARLLEDPDEGVRQLAVAAVAKRPAWTEEAIGRVRLWLPAPVLAAAEQESLRRLLAAFWGQETIRALATEALARLDLPIERRRMILEVWAETGQPGGLKDWRHQVTQAVTASDDALARAGISLVRASRTNQWATQLTGLALDPQRGINLRIAAVDALADASEPLSEPVHAFVLQQCQASGQGNPVVRLAAARILGRVSGTLAQLRARAAVVAGAGPVELPALLKAFENTSDDQLGMALIDALKNSPGLEALTAEQLERLAGRFAAPVRTAMEPLAARLRTHAGAQAERLKALEPALSGGNPASGRAVFFGPKSGCAVCHRIGGFGGALGPDLSSIGEVRTRRDLLEAIVYPSASFARGFEPIQVLRRDGETETGLLHQETEAAVELRMADQSIHRIPRAQISSVEIGTLSLMPQGLDAVLSMDELRSLLAFLESLRGQAR